MVISDFNIVCLKQPVPELIIQNGIGIDVISDKNGYDRHWKILKKSDGIWYQFFPIEREFGLYNDEFFDLNIQDMSYMATALKNHIVDLKKIINNYLAISPIHELLVLIRLDEFGESEKIIDISAENFITSLDSSKLLFNHIYHVRQ